MTPPPLLETTLEMSYVYLLRSLKDKKFYLGWSTNLKRRLDAHNHGLIRSTKNRTPFELVYYETYSEKKLAKAREHQLKHNPRMYSLFKKKVQVCASMPEGRKEVVG